MDMNTNDRTYATYKNAATALRKGCDRLGVNFSALRYVILADETGRFTPAVLHQKHGVPCSRKNSEYGNMPTSAFVHMGITVIG